MALVRRSDSSLLKKLAKQYPTAALDLTGLSIYISSNLGPASDMEENQPGVLHMVVDTQLLMTPKGLNNIFAEDIGLINPIYAD